MMNKILITVILALMAAQAQAANHYVLPAGSGSKSGADWSNAFQGIPATQVRGDTYFIGGGTGYGFTIFNQADVGTTYIFFKKATVADHGTSVGWLDTYGTTPATWHNNGQCWEIRTDYLDFDGVTGDKTHGDLNYGIVATDSESGASGQRAVIICYSGQHAIGIRLHHLEVSGLGPDQVNCLHQVAGLLCNANQGQSDSWFVEYCYIHDVANWSSLALTPNVVLSHCWFKNAGSSCFSNHGNGINFSGDNMTIAYCVLENMLGGANTTYVEPQGAANQAASNWHIYGCLYLATDPTENTTQWANLSAVASNYTVNNQFYNNTSYGLHGPIGVSFNSLGGRVPINGGNNIVQNNLWVNCANSDGLPDANVQSKNITSGVSSGANFGDTPWTSGFVNAANLDFHLTGNTASGVTLLAPYNLDPDGATRQAGNWSIGAFQFTGGPPAPQPPNQPSNLTPANAATSVSLTTTLTASAYSDPASKPQQAAQWQLLDQSNNIIWDSGTAAAATSTSVPAGRLSYSTTYQWKVRYQNTLALWSVYSAPTTFTTIAPQPPATPANVTPANNATNVGLTPSLTASAYNDPQASPQIASQWQVYQGGNLVWDSGTVGAVTTFTVGTTLTPGTIYTWRARYESAFTLWSSWSAATAFTTIPTYAPNQPVNVSPANTSFNASLTPTLTATPFSDPNAPSLAQTAAEWLLRSNTIVLSDYVSGAVSNLVISAGVLTNSATYNWQVRYQNSSNLWSAYSVQTTFTTTNAPPLSPSTPFNIIPANPATGISITPTLIASTYVDPASLPQQAAQFQIYNSNSTSLVWDSGTLAPTTFTLSSQTLSNTTQYSWHARYQNNASLWSSYSPFTLFTTTNTITPPPPTPTNAVVNLIFQGTVTLNGQFISK